MAIAPAARAATVNETLRDRGVAHALMLEKLKATEARAIVKHYQEEVVPDLLAKLTARLALIEERGLDLGPLTTQRLQDMLGVMQEAIDVWSTGLATELADRAAEIGSEEIKWQRALLESAMPIVWDTVLPPLEAVRAAVLGSPLDGTLLETIVERMGAQSKLAAEKAIRLGVSEGEGIAKITARLRQATDLTSTTAEAVARTAVAHGSNMGRASFYAANDDLIKGVQWHATLDTRTCASCGALDGKMFPVASGARPPRHINCRCTTVPVLKSMKDLGFDLPDFPLSTRASMGGQVPESTTFATWLKGMPPGIQDEALGAKRGALYRSGKVDVKDFVDPQGELYTLDQLRTREAAAFKAAGV